MIIINDFDIKYRSRPSEWGGFKAISRLSRFTVTIFTYCKNGGNLPVTKGKPGNSRLPIGKNLVYQLRFLKVKANF